MTYIKWGMFHVAVITTSVLLSVVVTAVAVEQMLVANPLNNLTVSARVWNQELRVEPTKGTNYNPQQVYALIGGETL